MKKAGAGLTEDTPYDPTTAPYIVKSQMIYHFARFEISGKTMVATVTDWSGNIIDAFKILPPTRNIFPAHDEKTSTCAPTLIASPFVSKDGASHQGSQWIVRNASNNSIVYISSCLDEGTNASYSCFDTQHLSRFTPPQLECGQHYQWQVVYQDSNGNTTQASALTAFHTPAKTGKGHRDNQR
jgi:hypothetical protein